MFCTKCGHEVKEGVSFCTNCGNKLFSQNSCYDFKSEENKSNDSEKYQYIQNDSQLYQHENIRGNENSLIPILIVILAFITVLIIGALLIYFDFFGPKNSPNEYPSPSFVQDSDSAGETVTQTQKTVEMTTQAETETYMSDEERRLTEKMYALMDDNLYCVLDMYYFKNHLPTTGKSVGYNLLQVSSGKFANYDAYESFIYSVYEKNFGFKKFINPCKYMRGDAGQLGYNVVFNENGEYYDIADYNVDWSDYKLAIDSYSDRMCSFTVTATERTSNGTRDYIRSGIAYYQNGKWLLENVIY